MWFFKRRNKVFLEDFSFEIFKETFDNEINNNIVNLFHSTVNIPELTKYMSDDQIKAIYLEIYSLIIYLNYPHVLCLRLEDSLKDYILNVRKNNFLYEYILSDYNTALSDEVSKSYSRNDAITLIDRRFQLFKSYITMPKLLGGNYNEIVVARVLNRMGANKKDLDKYLLAIGVQFFKNEDYKSFSKEELVTLLKLFKIYHTDLSNKISEIKLF